MFSGGIFKTYRIAGEAIGGATESDHLLRSHDPRRSANSMLGIDTLFRTYMLPWLPCAGDVTRSVKLTDSMSYKGENVTQKLHGIYHRCFP
jgi:hypothetical protein